MQLASTRTSIALDYGEVRRANVATHHGHDFGPKHQESYVKLEGTQGAIVARIGVNLDYPRGLPDALEVCVLDGATEPRWESIPLVGDWFPHAFVGPMASLMRRAEGESTELPTSVEDAYRTMAVVEACYESSAHGAVRVPS
jgi:predicted dehydrogenase